MKMIVEKTIVIKDREDDPKWVITIDNTKGIPIDVTITDGCSLFAIEEFNDFFDGVTQAWRLLNDE